MLRIVNFVFYLLVVLLGLAFAVGNSDVVALNWYFGVWHVPLSLALVLILALGALLGIIACLSILLKYRREAVILRKALQLCESEARRPVRTALEG